MPATSFPRRCGSWPRTSATPATLRACRLFTPAKDQPGKYRIISGHHRIEAARTAGLDSIMVMVTEPASDEDVISKQLAHNALVGKDDPVILAELFAKIKDIQLRLATGLNDEIAKISYPSLNFKLGATRQFALLFVPEDAIAFDNGLEALEEFARSIPVTASTEVRIVSTDNWKHFADLMRRVKKSENIKSNATAMLFLIQLATEGLARKANGKAETTSHQETEGGR